MKKTQLIKKIIGKELEPYGFKYLKTEGPMRIFVREVTGMKRYYDPENDVIKQYINVQESRFAQELTVRFSADAYGSGMNQELEILQEIYGRLWFEYSNAEEYEKLLQVLSEVIIKYGLEFLNELSIEDEIIPTKAMAEYLFENHSKLDKSFVEEYKMVTIPQNESDIEEWFQFLERLIIQETEKPYEEAKELLLKIAAFIGERNCEIIGEKWFFEEGHYTPYTQCEGELLRRRRFYPLIEVIGYYRTCKQKKGNLYWFLYEIAELKKVLQDEE